MMSTEGCEAPGRVSGAASKALMGLVTAVSMSLGTVIVSSPANALTCANTDKGATYGGGTGTDSDPYLISSKAHLDALGNTTNSDTWKCAFRQTGDISMEASTWENKTIGNAGEMFFGSYDGGGYAITDLTISVTADGTTLYAGLFGEVYAATISGVRLSATVTKSGEDDGGAYVAGLVANAEMTAISDSSFTGSVTGTGDDDEFVGGLVGVMVEGSITNASSEGSVSSTGATGPNTRKRVGGLVGYVNRGTITDSHSSASVVGNQDEESSAGGLVGYLAGSNAEPGSITGSYATGSVQGYEGTGGLVGVAEDSTVSRSYATGSVSGRQRNGGLIGTAEDDVTVSESYATGAVTGSSVDNGGLIGNAGYVDSGDNTGTVTVARSFATGSVEAGQDAGGLIGDIGPEVSVTDSYARGSASSGSSSRAGGLAGENGGEVVRSYSTGAASGSGDVGGLVGVSPGTTSRSLWDVDSSGLTTSAGGAGVSGESTSSMKAASTFSAAGWSIASGFSTSTTWGICGPVNDGYPFLTWVHATDPCAEPDRRFEFVFVLPDGQECSAISPSVVSDGQLVALPGVDAECKTMPGSQVRGWVVSVPEDYSGIGSTQMPFAPGHEVRASGSQRFVLVPFEPMLSLTYDANVATADACRASEREFLGRTEDGRSAMAWVPRQLVAQARFPEHAVCSPPGHVLSGWRVGEETYEAGSPLPAPWATGQANGITAYAQWQAL